MAKTMGKKSSDEMKRLMSMAKALTKTYDSNDVFVPIQLQWGTRRLSVKSREFRNVMAKRYYDAYDQFPSDHGLTQLVAYLLAEGLEHQSENPRYRINSKDGAIYYDLCRNEGCVKISEDGWAICREEEHLFKQYACQQRQAIPESSEDGLEILQAYVNLAEQDWLLFVVYLISCFHPDIQHPILNVRGSRGTGKSTILEVVKKLVDPSTQKPGSLNNSTDSLFVQLSSCYYTIFDNLSQINRRQSDIFCQVVTGGGLVKRALYTDSDTVSLNFTSLVAFNGILDVVRKDDLAQRTLFFKTQPLAGKERIADREFWECFELEKPAILGAIFDVLASALAIYPNVELKQYHRLGDFDKLGYAIAESMDEGLGEEFLAAVTRNEQAQMDVIYDGSPLVRMVLDFMSDLPRWEGRTTKFYKYLHDYTCEDMGEEYDEQDFPINPAILGKRMTALLDVFESFGLDVEIRRDKDNYSYITLINTRYVG